MRIITGALKGRKLTVPPNTDIRPTSDRTKESIFNIIETRKELKNTLILDLYAGTGNLGFEAISRGAEYVTFVEKNEKALEAIGESALKFGVANQVQMVQSDVATYLSKQSSPYDIVFADPPYDDELLPVLPDKILNGNWLKEGGWFILEHDARHKFSDHERCTFAKPYGRTIVSIFR